MYSDKSCCTRAKNVVLGQNGCIPVKVVVFGQKWLYSSKDSNWAKVSPFGQSGCLRAKVVVLGQMWMYSGKSGFIRAKVVVFGQTWLYFGKVVVFGQK